MLEKIYLIGAVASIIALLFAFVAIIYKIFKKYQRLKTESEQQFQEQLKRYEAASRTLGARTDLGFFLLNTLGKYRTIIINNNIYAAMFSLITAISVVINRTLRDSSYLSPSYILVLNIFTILFIIFAVTLFITAVRYVILEQRFDDYFRKLWETPIQKHINRQTDSKDETS